MKRYYCLLVFFFLLTGNAWATSMRLEIDGRDYWCGEVHGTQDKITEYHGDIDNYTMPTLSVPSTILPRVIGSFFEN